MPELPDVEIFKRYLDSTALHQPVERAEVKSRTILDGVEARQVQSALENRQLTETRRHGKYLLVRLDEGEWLTLHFGMTGGLQYFKNPERDPLHDRLLISFDNGYHLAFDCQRMLGSVGLVDSPEELIERKDLGPDALELDRPAFHERLQGRRGMVKPALMNQRIIAGIGNVYSDEILFQARYHPKTAVKDLNTTALDALFDAMREVLQTAIDCRADPDRFPDSYLLPHRGEGGPCPVCGGEIEKVKVSGRGTYYCPACQLAP